MISRLPNLVELSRKWPLKKNASRNRVYAILFDDYEECPFECPPGHSMASLIGKQVPGDLSLCVLKVS